VVTATSTGPAAWRAVVAVMEVAEFTVYGTGAPPTLTPLTPVNDVPVSVTVVPPVVRPIAGDTAVTAGGATKVKDPAGVDDPTALETTTLTAPAAWAGVVKVREVSDVAVYATEDPPR
jgi:hypothetical protein